ncbi:MAG: serine hydrolase [Mariniblastus sp.]
MRLLRFGYYLAFFGVVSLCLSTSLKGQTDEKSTLDLRLVQSIKRGDLEAVQAAISEGADVNKKDKWGFTPYEAARRTGFQQIADFLVAKGAKSDVAVPSPEEYVEKLLSEKFTDSTPACVVLVARDGEITMQKAFGQSDIAGKQSATTATKFRIGSVTKQFTAAAILKLEEEGKLSVEDELSKYLPDFPRGSEVTLKHLLTHTSGIVSYTSKTNSWLAGEKAFTEEEIIAIIQGDEFEFKPGEKYSYCNTGYLMLGHIVGKVTNSNLETYLEKTFFEPLGMKNTGIHRPDLDLSNEANGYSVVDGQYELKNLRDMSWAAGAGAMYSTAGDLFLWNEALFANRVLKKETLERAFKPTTLSDGSISNYGFGWMLGGTRGLKSIEHGGGLPGFLTHLVRYPKTKTTIAVFVNAHELGELLPPTIIARLVADAFLWESMDVREVRMVDKSVDANVYQDFVGEYQYGAATMEVTIEDGKIFSQLSGQSKFEIFPSSSTKFFWKVVDAEVEFRRAKDGKVVCAMHTQNGTTEKAPRLPDTMIVPTEKLTKYVGRYDYGSGVMSVTSDGRKLFAQITGQPKMRIYPISETKFEWRGVKAEVEFVAGDDGETLKAVHTQNGRSFDAPKVDLPTSISVLPEKLEEYAGSYSFGFFAGKMVITRVGDKMYAKFGSQPKLEIIPIAVDEFAWLDVVATMKFVRDKDGKITRGDFTQSGKTTKANRVKK